MTNRQITYNVIRVRACWYRVYRANDRYRDHIRSFFRLSSAEACAKGLAEGTWFTDGPIMASFLVPEEPETPPAVKTDNPPTVKDTDDAASS